MKATGIVLVSALCLLAAASLQTRDARAAQTEAGGGDLLEVSLRDGRGAPVADGIVAAYPAKGAPAMKLPAAPSREVIDQIDSEFVPEVKVIRTGTEVIFPNKDNTRHHVYSFSRAKKFELPLYKGVPAEPVIFDKPGLVVLGCNIHDWMVGYVYVLETPWFARTGADGAASLSGLPPGEYDLVVYHPRAKNPGEPAARQKATLSGGTPVKAGFTLALSPDNRRNRATRTGDAAYP